jgi:hypothetical protein
MHQTDGETGVRARLSFGRLDSSTPPLLNSPACSTMNSEQGAVMPATGELIRLMNYIDDIATTLRRISASIPAMTPEECARLGEYIRKSEPSYESVLQHLEQAGKE